MHLEIFEANPSLKDIKEPLPTLFYFALSGHESLNLDPYNQIIKFLTGKKIRLYSFTLPHHGGSLTPNEAMKAWAEELDAGKDPMEKFLTQAQENISKLFEANLIDPKFCAVSGLSRGAYAAGRLAAIDSRVTHILGFAPLVRQTHPNDPTSFYPYPLFDYLDKLVGKPLKFLIGNHDTRVDTDTVYTFIKQLTLLSIEKGIRSPQVELSIKPSVGFKGHGSAPETFHEGAEWIINQCGQI